MRSINSPWWKSRRSTEGDHGRSLASRIHQCTDSWKTVVTGVRRHTRGAAVALLVLVPVGAGFRRSKRATQFLQIDGDALDRSDVLDRLVPLVGVLRDSGARRAAIQAGQTGEIGDGGGGSYTTLCSDLIADAPSNGFLPVTASNRMQPNEKMPERWSISLVFPCACFRRHVADRAHGRARRGVVRPHGRRQSEIENLRVPIARDHDVVGLRARLG
jgi:hypothetical protein